MANILDKTLSIVDKLVGAGWETSSDPAGYRWGKKDIQEVYNLVESEYGNPEQYINKASILKALGTTYMKNLLGIEPDPYADKFYSVLSDAYRGKKYNKEELKNIFGKYESQFDLFTGEGEGKVHDVIDRELFKVKNIQELHKQKFPEKWGN